VVLDEPTTGLDVDGRRALWDVIREQVASGVTVLLTTHHLHEAEALADEVSVIDGGRVLAHGSVGEIKAGVDVGRVRLRAAAGSDLRELPGVVRVEEAGGVTMLLVTDADEAVRALVRKGIGFAGLEVTPVSLEEAVVTLTDERRAGAAVAP
jgi:ABC-2 type transport system ATP-binding protein